MQESYDPRRAAQNGGQQRPTAGQPQRQAPQRPQSAQENGGRQTQPQRKPPRRRDTADGKRWIRAIIMVFATIALCIFVAVYIIDTASDLFGLEQEDLNITITIPEGATDEEVGELLESAGVIKRAWVFNFYVSLKSGDNPFQSGKYIFNTNMGYDEIIRDLRSGDYRREEISLTFIEGWTVLDIAKHLEDNDVCSVDDFLDALQNGDYDYEFLNQVPNDPLRFRRLEGYLFPDTYNFYVGENPEDVVRRFLRNTNDKLDNELQDRMMAMNLTLDETIILASIIQREAGDYDDMRMVSSVFHNRLGLSGTYPNLQSDVTIFYVENNIKTYLEQSNQPMYDAYNTYVREGLPVGAICNPGMNAIRAALYPESTDYYFFVTDTEEEFYYAVTAEEHYRNVAEAMAVGGEAHGIDTQWD